MHIYIFNELFSKILQIKLYEITWILRSPLTIKIKGNTYFKII